MEFIAQIKGGMALTQQLLIFQGGVEVRLGDVEVRLREEVDATSSQETIGSLRREKKKNSKSHYTNTPKCGQSKLRNKTEGQYSFR